MTTFLYKNPIQIDTTTTLKMVLADGLGYVSELVEASYTIFPATIGIVAASVYAVPGVDSASVYYRTEAYGAFQSQKVQTQEGLGTLDTVGVLANIQQEAEQTIYSYDSKVIALSQTQAKIIEDISASSRLTGVLTNIQAKQTSSIGASYSQTATLNETQIVQIAYIPATASSANATIRFVTPNPPSVELNGTIHYKTESLLVELLMNVQSMQTKQSQTISSSGFNINLVDNQKQASQNTVFTAWSALQVFESGMQVAQGEDLNADYWEPNSARLISEQHSQKQSAVANIDIFGSMESTQQIQSQRIKMATFDFGIVNPGLQFKEAERLKSFELAIREKNFKLSYRTKVFDV